MHVDPVRPPGYAYGCPWIVSDLQNFLARTVQGRRQPLKSGVDTGM